MQPSIGLILESREFKALLARAKDDVRQLLEVRDVFEDLMNERHGADAHRVFQFIPNDEIDPGFGPPVSFLAEGQMIGALQTRKHRFLIRKDPFDDLSKSTIVEYIIAPMRNVPSDEWLEQRGQLKKRARTKRRRG